MKKYISTDRAAHVSGYTLDYVGQLCRSGKISCALIDSEWAVDVDDLKQYLIKRSIPVDTIDSEKTFSFTHDSKDQSIIFEGKKYISTTRASIITSYSQDYIGQLVRSKKLESIQIQGRWFVLFDSLQKYVAEQQSALLDQATNRVGFERPDRSRFVPVKSGSLLNYEKDETAPLIPSPFNNSHQVIDGNNHSVDLGGTSMPHQTSRKIYNTFHHVPQTVSQTQMQDVSLVSGVVSRASYASQALPLVDNSHQVGKSGARSYAGTALLASSVFVITFVIGALTLFPKAVITKIPVIDTLLSLTTASITVEQ